MSETEYMISGRMLLYRVTKLSGRSNDSKILKALDLFDIYIYIYISIVVVQIHESLLV